MLLKSRHHQSNNKAANKGRLVVNTFGVINHVRKFSGVGAGQQRQFEKAEGGKLKAEMCLLKRVWRVVRYNVSRWCEARAHRRYLDQVSVRRSRELRMKYGRAGG